MTHGRDSEGRERLELRAKTGLADFLKAAAGGTSVSGAAAEYAASLGIPTSGHLPMALFGRTATTNPHVHLPTVETRAVTPGPAVKGMLQPVVPFVFERSAAASLGISAAVKWMWRSDRRGLRLKVSMAQQVGSRRAAWEGLGL